MKINISKINRDIDLEMNFGDSLNLENIEYKGEIINLCSPVIVDGIIKNLGDHYKISGNIRVNLILQCSRCLDKFNYNKDIEFEEEMSNNSSNLEYIHFNGNEIDIADIIIENIIINLPINFICNDNCKGLCQYCGVNLNKSNCTCSEDNVDPRLKVLKNLLNRD